MIPKGNGAAQPGFFLLRSGDCTIDDNWHTMGLAGTGSKNIVVRDAFVPFHRTLAFAAEPWHRSFDRLLEKEELEEATSDEEDDGNGDDI